MWMIEQPDNKLDSKVPHEWHSNVDDGLWLCRFVITKNKHQFKATEGQEHVLSQIAHIENNTEPGRDLTRSEITDLLYPPMQCTTASQQETELRGKSKDGGLPPLQRWQECMERSLDQDELSLENLSVSNPPQNKLGYHDIYPHGYVKSQKERSQERCQYKSC